MILKFILNTQLTWMIFIKTLKNTTQIKKRKILIVFYDVIGMRFSVIFYDMR